MGSIPVWVPTSLCLKSTLSARELELSHVKLGEDARTQAKLRPSAMHTRVGSNRQYTCGQLDLLVSQVFANFTLGFLSGQGDAASGHSSRLDVDDAMRARIIVTCAQFKVSKHCRPSSAQAVEIAAELQLPTIYGEAVYHLLLTRLLGFIDRNITLDHLPTALLYSEKRVYWMAHTREWDATTTMDAINAATPTIQVRTYQAQTHNFGFKRIVDGAVRSVAITGAFDIYMRPLHSDNHRPTFGPPEDPIHFAPPPNLSRSVHTAPVPTASVPTASVYTAPASQQLGPVYIDAPTPRSAHRAQFSTAPLPSVQRPIVPSQSRGPPNEAQEPISYPDHAIDVELAAIRETLTAFTAAMQRTQSSLRSFERFRQNILSSFAPSVEHAVEHALGAKKDSLATQLEAVLERIAVLEMHHGVVKSEADEHTAGEELKVVEERARPRSSPAEFY